MGTKLGESADLFDVDTGKWVGALDAHGREQIVPTFNDDETALVGSDGAVTALSEATTESLATASATTQILTGPGEYFAYRCTVAAGNITIYDNTSSSGKVLVPTTALAVGAFPIYGAGIGRSVIVDNGIRVVLSGAATVYIGHTGY